MIIILILLVIVYDVVGEMSRLSLPCLSNVIKNWGWAPRYDQERIVDDFLQELKPHPHRYG